jgi:homocysteine S-methyltransferase
VLAVDALRARRAAGEIIVLDGAMGTELEARGATMDSDAWCGLVNLYEPQLVRAVHEDHIRAGAEVVITNTFMSGLGPMTRAGAGDEFGRGIHNALRAARAARDGVAERPVAIAGSVGATSWGRPSVSGSAASEISQLRDGYARQVELLVEGGADLIALEMVTDARLGSLAVDAALDSGLPVWLGLSMRVAGSDPSEYESLPDVEPHGRTIAEACLRDQLDAVNVMHTDIRDVTAAISMLKAVWTGSLGVYPHHGLWARPHWTFKDVPTDDLLGLANTWATQGAAMLGGCCGLRTQHVAALREFADQHAQGLSSVSTSDSSGPTQHL